MRLSAAQQAAIVNAARHWFGPEVRVRLFGSRTDDQARGGDIDLFIDLDRPLDRRVETAARFEADLVRVLGDRHIDVVVRDPSMPEQEIHRQARAHGITLT